MDLSSSKCTEQGKKLLVPQQKMLKLAGRGSVLSLSGTKCGELALRCLSMPKM